MIVSCPSCTSRYLVDPQVLGAAGRKVRCANCGHVWHQTAPMDANAPAPIAMTPPVTTPQPLPEGSNLPAMPDDVAPRRSSAIGWLVLLLVVIGVIGGLLLARKDVVSLWPPAARLYGLIGLDDFGRTGAGLEIREVASQRLEQGGSTALVVQGTIVNVSTRPRPVPNVQVVARGAGGVVLKSWSFAPGAPILLPGDSVPFRRELADAPDGATELGITLADE